jgi:hypothetical protein
VRRLIADTDEEADNGRTLEGRTRSKEVRLPINRKCMVSGPGLVGISRENVTERKWVVAIGAACSPET